MCDENKIPNDVLDIPDEASDDNEFNDISERQMGQLLSQLKDMVGMLESQWESSKREFQITDDHMKLLYQFNEEHRTPPPEGASDEEMEEYDNFNGLDTIPEEKAFEIFGEEHPIIGYPHSITIDRIKSVVSDFFSWMGAVKEYRSVHDAYMEVIEYKEEQEIELLKKLADKEEDPIKKETMDKSIDLYYNRKYLDFLSEPLDEKTIERLVAAFSDTKKISYWIERTRSKLGQLKISSKFILEISQFEKRFLPEKYHQQSNLFLLYFMNLIVYTDIGNKKDNNDRSKIICTVFAIDRFIRNQLKGDIKERIMNNIIAFQEQFVGKLSNEIND